MTTEGSDMQLSSPDLIVELGEQPVVRGTRAAVSTAGSFSTRAALRILQRGGNAMDAAIAASLVDGVTNCLLTSHAGSVVGLFWHAASKTLVELNSTGVFPTAVPVCTPLPDVGHPLTGPTLLACAIPGFMPGLGAIHERFGTQPWSELCEEAIEWADAGFPMSSFNYGLHYRSLPYTTYFPESRELFLQNGFVPPVGKRFRNPDLAATLRRLAADGPQEFVAGNWASQFVTRANALGWQIQKRHLTEAVPRWCEPLRYAQNDLEIVQLAPPQSHGIISSLVLRVLHEVGVDADYPLSAERLYYMAHALRWANRDGDYVNDPAIFMMNPSPWLGAKYAQLIAQILRGAHARRDLSEHAHLLLARSEMAAAGISTTPSVDPARSPCGSCEISIVDQYGNWVQMLNTMQTGGIPGSVVGGVPMFGSGATFGTLSGRFASWVVPEARPRFIVGSTLVFKDGQPVIGLGAAGQPVFHVPQALANIVGGRMNPADAVRAPRIIAPLSDENILRLEDRVPADTLQGLVALGLRPQLAKPFDLDAGWFQCAWRDPETGSLCAYTDPRGNGVAGALG
jgi:gamma-glutamyltranspeptidase/glutathione hydrolase